MRYTDCGTLDANANQKLTWGLQCGTTAAPFDLTGCAVTCQIRATAQPGTPIITPSVSLGADPTLGVLTFSYTQAQAASFVVPGVTPPAVSKFYVEADLAYSDDPTHPSERFWWTISVSPGGNS
jgi:hypothetical protein